MCIRDRPGYARAPVGFRFPTCRACLYEANARGIGLHIISVFSSERNVVGLLCCRTLGRMGSFPRRVVDMLQLQLSTGNCVDSARTRSQSCRLPRTLSLFLARPFLSSLIQTIRFRVIISSLTLVFVNPRTCQLCGRNSRTLFLCGTIHTTYRDGF